MTRSFCRSMAICAVTACAMFSSGCYALENANSAGEIVVAAKKPKCSAPGAEEFEGTDMSGVTPKCDAIFNTCIDESAPCAVRKQKCAEFDKMDRNGSCYKKRRS